MVISCVTKNTRSDSIYRYIPVSLWADAHFKATAFC